MGTVMILSGSQRQTATSYCQTVRFRTFDEDRIQMGQTLRQVTSNSTITERARTISRAAQPAFPNWNPTNTKTNKNRIGVASLRKSAIMPASTFTQRGDLNGQTALGSPHTRRSAQVDRRRATPAAHVATGVCAISVAKG